MSANEKIEKHKLVQFKYRIRDDQTVLEQVDIPVGYVHGTENGMFEKVENALAGHDEGDTIEVKLSPAEGFGDYYQEMVYVDDINNVPEEFRTIDAEVDFQSDRGETKKFRVTKIENGKLTLDGNHPLAGKELIFTIDIVSIRDATKEEIEEGRLPGELLTH
jgi:FKBP-type peptidyl-prolyl cis-trans isomerase SlyD